MKSETGHLHPLQFVGLRPKMYSLLVPSIDKAKMTAKGVKKSFVDRKLKHQHYLDVLCSGESTSAQFCIIRSKRHNIETARISKVCLSAFDDKRYVLSDGVNTLAHGHFRISCDDHTL